MRALLKTIAWALVFIHSPVRAVAQGAYAKIEAAFNIANLATDPFDYTVTDVRVKILQPDNSTVLLPAFFDGGTTWRVRHTPTLPGTYSVAGVTMNGSALAVSGLQPSSWTVAGPPTGAGFIRIDPTNPRRFATSNGRRYFPHGQDVAWDVTDGSVTHNVTNIFWKMGAAHENWSRVWMDFWDGKNLDWPPGGRTLPLGQLNLSVAQKWDAIVAAAEQAGIYFQMTLHHHGEYSTTVDPNWAENPYDVTNNIGSTNGFMTSPVQFFTNATAIALTERKLRYSVARWGYSPSIMAWELFNEVQYTDAAQTGQWGIIQAWHDQMAAFLRAQDVYQHLITTSSDLNAPIWDDCDYYTHHDYPSDVITGLEDAPDLGASQPVRPDFGSECATNGVPQFGVDAPLWSGMMNGQSGTEDPWWWDSLDAENDYGYFQAAGDFITLSGLGNQNSLNKSAPVTTGGAFGPLEFAFGGGWTNAAQDTFNVGEIAPDGVGTAPSYLQGNYHRAMTPNGFTFDVNYPQAGTFSVQVLQIAASGAALEIFIDGGVNTNISFPSAAGDTSTNFTAAVAVPSGAHTINITDPGQDWILLGNLTFSPYAPALAAYAVGNSNWNATWVWNRTNIFSTNATSATTGTVQVAGLNAGAYSGVWWDTFAGVVISNFTFAVANSNTPITLATPPVLRSVALYAGLPPQAGLAASNLAQTLGTNSPLLAVPLTVNNNGGLPLTYSFAITNASPVNYTAINSTQPGGPAYVWRDYSAIGQDISSNFTPLAPPKSARDEGIAGPFNIGFAFPFFTNSYSQLYVSPNGFITFSPFAGDTSTNKSLPNVSAPSNQIAFFWTDLYENNSGHVFTYADTLNGTFTIEFTNMFFKGTTSTVNCEVVLKTTGEILMACQSMSVSNACTVGVQNFNATQGTTVAFDQNYLQSNFAVLLTPTPWLRFDANAGVAPGFGSNVASLSFNPAGLAVGTNAANILVQTSDPSHPLFTLPVSLVLSPLASWRQLYFGTAQNSGPAANYADPAGDGIANIFAYAFGLNPLLSNPDPMAVTQAGNYLQVAFKRPHPAPVDITYLPQISTNLASGVWLSGPAYASQSVVNNGNGTETVTVTDLTPIGSAREHFLRILIEPQ